jgi:hypothetical protein
MDPSSQHLDAPLSVWRESEASKHPYEVWLNQLHVYRQAQLARLKTAAAGLHDKASPKIAQATQLASAGVDLARHWQVRAYPAILPYARHWLPFIAWPEPTERSGEPDIVQQVLHDFEALDEEAKVKVARNLGLLWENFQSSFGGISGFLSAPQIEQDAFMDRLKAAAERMATARGSSAAFHYVTVELLRQYMSFFKTGRSDGNALRLASCAANLIDQSRQISAQPIAYSIAAE